MFLKLSKSSEKVFWTKHSKKKMRQYRLSEKRVLRILRRPNRVEEGIVEDTIAAMQIAGTKKHPTEIWVMYQLTDSKRKNLKQKAKKVKIISTWRYPGRTPLGKQPLVPLDTLRELDRILNG